MPLAPIIDVEFLVNRGVHGKAMLLECHDDLQGDLARHHSGLAVGEPWRADAPKLGHTGACLLYTSPSPRDRG